MLNQLALNVARSIQEHAERLKVHVTQTALATIIDCGVNTPGSLEVGLLLARVCLADLARVEVVPYRANNLDLPGIQVSTDSPVLACLASQYAGWQVSVGKYFAMGSGPMRAAAGREELFHEIAGKETTHLPVGVLESRRLPSADVIESIQSKFADPIDQLTLLIAPTSSLAGTIQVVARSVETAMHKLHTLKFNVNQVVAGYGVAPLPPVAKDELQAVGRTNDAILYGAMVNLWVDCDDGEIERMGSQVPSSSSHDYGELFHDLFLRYGDFYKIDPMLFSPAKVTFNNIRTGRTWSYGSINAQLLYKSFFE